MQPIRFFTRFKKRAVQFIEGNCTNIDVKNKVLTVEGKLWLESADSCLRTDAIQNIYNHPLIQVFLLKIQTTLKS